VGSSSWEELNMASGAGGQNFGYLNNFNCINDLKHSFLFLPQSYKFCRWPCKEGPESNGAFQSMCSGLSFTEALVFWGRSDDAGGYGVGFHGNCACGVVPYTGTSYPSRYKQPGKRAIFFADYAGLWINVLWVDENDNILPDETIEKFDNGVGNVFFKNIFETKSFLMHRIHLFDFI
jgi:hypothetical protein